MSKKLEKMLNIGYKEVGYLVFKVDGLVLVCGQLVYIGDMIRVGMLVV